MTPCWQNQCAVTPVSIVESDDGKVLVAYYAASKSTNEHWMRVVWNIVENCVRTETTFIKCIKMIDKYLIIQQEGASVLQNVKQWCEQVMRDDDFKDFREQVKEEIEKARIYAGEFADTLVSVDLLHEAESYSFFHGSIRFLFRDEECKFNWNDFKIKFENAKKNFCQNGLKEECYPKANKVVLYYAALKKSDSILRKHLFNRKAENWKTILLNDDLGSSIHHFLMGDDVVGPLPNDITYSYGVNILLQSEIWNFMQSDYYELRNSEIWEDSNQKLCLWLSHNPLCSYRLQSVLDQKIIDLISSNASFCLNETEVLCVGNSKVFKNTGGSRRFSYKTEDGEFYFLMDWRNKISLCSDDKFMRIMDGNTCCYTFEVKVQMTNDDILNGIKKMIEERLRRLKVGQQSENKENGLKV